jgi:hypothetical protein
MGGVRWFILIRMKSYDNFRVNLAGCNGRVVL